MALFDKINDFAKTATEKTASFAKATTEKAENAIETGNHLAKRSSCGSCRARVPLLRSCTGGAHRARSTC